ncbi:hypothetical protein FNL39_102335 [Nocardia caishijiensis]|uniref:Uncharacterized protein n=1 Tax=Nocardia caishijiensis TaxID=184756 RepID=A0ABQ6YQV5_9NOCA|nr:hypothetical protein FNL39_102335 [Nocardia caishijiensis]
MTIYRDFLHLLNRCGLRVQGPPAGHHNDSNFDLLILTPDGHRRPTSVKLYAHKLTPSDVRRHRPDRNLEFQLYGTDTAPTSILAAALAGEFDLVTTRPPRVILEGKVLLEQHPTADPRHDRRRVPWQRLAVQRLLAICEQPMTQNDLVTATGATQQAVSVATRKLKHVTRSLDNHKWIGTPRLLDDWYTAYPSPRGLQQHWYGLDDAAVQYDTARELLTELDVWSVLSGDLGADQYSPWMRPSTVRLYVGEVVDFTGVGFSPTDASAATLTIVVPQDQSILPAARYFTTDPATDPNRAPHLVADPAMIWWDLQNTSTDPTAIEAAQHLRATIEQRRAD